MKIVLLLLALLLPLAAPAATLPSGSAALFPADTLIVGAINLTRLLSATLFADSLQAIREIEKAVGEKLDFGTLAFAMRPVAGGGMQTLLLVDDDIAEFMTFEAKTVGTHRGAKLLSLDDDGGFFAKSGAFGVWADSLAGLKASLDARAGANLARSRQVAVFNEALARTRQAVFSIGIAVDAALVARLVPDPVAGASLAGVLKHCDALALGIDYKGNALVLTLAARTATPARAAELAKTVRDAKAEAAPLFGPIFVQLGARGAALGNESFRSFAAAAEGRYLVLSASIPEEAVAALARQMMGGFLGMLAAPDGDDGAPELNLDDADDYDFE